MSDSIQNIYNNLPANFWEYQKLFSSYQSYILFFLLLIVLILLIRNSRNNKKLKKMIVEIPGLKANRELINEVKEHGERFLNLEIINKATETNLKKIDQDLKNVYRNETIEYNPYQDTGVGGNQSFSTAFINQRGNGIILTSLYARDRTRLIFKNIQNLKCEKELSPEEKEVLIKFKK